jgi:hypothetical protein
LHLKDIFAFIIEIERAADLSIPRGIPAIALCDLESQDNWVSQNFIDYLSKYFSGNINLTNQSKGRKAGDEAHINIRWTCEKLGQHSEEGTFFIKPKAHFKILFGCGYRITNNPVRVPRSVYFPRPSHSVSQRRSKTEPPLSTHAADGFRRGIEEGTLLKLKRMPDINQGENPYISVTELETELEYVYSSYSLTDQALNSVEEESSTYQYPPSREMLSNAMGISSSHSSVTTENDEHTSTFSTNTSISEEAYKRHSLSEQLRRERSGAQPPFSLSGWFRQSIYEEPQPWIPRMVQQPERKVFGFTQCKMLDSRRQLALEEAKAVAEKESAQYWIWDDKVKNYKHNDEGCAEPVWYNPP